MRINDHLAEINGRSPEEHIGRTLAEMLPGLPEVGDERAPRGGRRASPRPRSRCAARRRRSRASQREWVASYWPVRAAAGGELLGVGTVVFDVTDRRAAERALRTQTDRYETLLTALSEVGEGMVVIEDGRCVYANHAFEQLSGYTFPELTALESLFELVEPDEREEAAAPRAAADRSATSSTRPTRSRSGAATAAACMLELAGVPLEIAGPAARASQLVVVVRDVDGAAARRGRARAAAGAAPRCSRRRARCSTSRSTRSARCAASPSCACATSPTRAWSCSAPIRGRRGGAIAVARDPARERALAAAAVLDGRTGDPVAEVLRTGAARTPASTARGRCR